MRTLCPPDAILQRQRSEQQRLHYRISTCSSSDAPSAAPQQPSAGTSSSSSSGVSNGLQTFTVAPVDTPTGVFAVAVSYQPATTVHILEVRSNLLA